MATASAASGPPLGIGQMIKISVGDHKGETGVLMEQGKSKCLVQLLGEKSSEKLYFLPQHIKPMYLSDSPRVNLTSNKHNEPPHEHLSISPTHSHVSSITSPTIVSQISAPDGSNFRKYVGGDIEPGHGVRIVGGTYQGLRGFVMEKHRVKLLVRLEHTEQDVILMPSNLGPWEKSTHNVLKTRNQPLERAKGASPSQRFWSPGKERAHVDDATLEAATKDSSEGSDLDLMFSHTSDLGGVKIDLSGHSSSNESTAENTDPAKQPVPQCNSKKENSASKTRQQVGSPMSARLGSPLRRRRLKAASPDKTGTQADKSTPQNRSIFKRRGRKDNSFKPTAASAASVSSTEPSTGTDSEPSSNLVAEGTYLKAHKDRQKTKLQDQATMRLHSPITTARDGDSHQSPLRITPSRSILMRKRSPSPGRRVDTSHGDTVPSSRNSSPQKKLSSPKATTPKASTPRGTSPRAPSSTPMNSPRESPAARGRSRSKSPGPVPGNTEPVSTPRNALRNKFSFKNVQKSPSPRSEAPTRGRRQEPDRDKTFRRPHQQQEAKKAESPKEPSQPPPPEAIGRSLSPLMLRRRKAEPPKEPSQPPPPEAIGRSLSPLMLRRRTMSRARAVTQQASPQQPASTSTASKSFSLSPRMTARRRESRLKTAQGIKGGNNKKVQAEEPKKPETSKGSNEPLRRASSKPSFKEEVYGNKALAQKVKTEKSKTKESKRESKGGQSVISKREENRLMMRQASAVKMRNDRRRQEQEHDEESTFTGSDETQSQRSARHASAGRKHHDQRQQSHCEDEESFASGESMSQSSKSIQQKFKRHASAARRRSGRQEQQRDEESTVSGGSSKASASESFQQKFKQHVSTSRRRSDGRAQEQKPDDESTYSSGNKSQSSESIEQVLKRHEFAVRRRSDGRLKEQHQEEFAVRRRSDGRLEEQHQDEESMASGGSKSQTASERIEQRFKRHGSALRRRSDRRQREHPSSEESTTSGGNMSQASEALEQACSWSFSTTASTEAILRKYSEASSRPRPAKSIRVVTTPVQEESSVATTPTQREPANTTANVSSPPVKESTNVSNESEDASHERKPADTRPPLSPKSSKAESPKAKTESKKEESSKTGSSKPDLIDLEDESPETEEMIIAKYNQILQRRMNTIKQQQNAEQASVGNRSKQCSSSYISDDEESEGALMAGTELQTKAVPAFGDKNNDVNIAGPGIATKVKEVEHDENVHPFSEPMKAWRSLEPEREGNHDCRAIPEKACPEPTQSRLTRAITNSNGDGATTSQSSHRGHSRQRSTSSISFHSATLASHARADQSRAFGKPFYDGTPKSPSPQRSSSPTRSESLVNNRSSTRYRLEELSIDSSGSAEGGHLGRESPIPEPPLSTKALLAQQEARRKSFEDQRRAAKQSTPRGGKQGKGFTAYSAPEFARERPETYRLPMEPQLFTQKLLAQTLDPPPPPPLPGQKPRPSPKKKSSVFAPTPPPPPITPRTPGGSRPAFAEAPASTPRSSQSYKVSTSPHQHSPLTAFAEPSPSSKAPRTPNGSLSILTESSPRASPPSMRSSSPIRSPVGHGPFSPAGRSSPVNTRYGTSFGYGSDTVCDLVTANSSATTLDGESLEDTPSSAMSREQQQRRNRNMFQKSLFKATSTSNNKSSRHHNVAALKNVSSPLQEVRSSPANTNLQQRRSSKNKAASPISIITKQSFSPEASSRSSVSKAKDNFMQKVSDSVKSKKPKSPVKSPRMKLRQSTLGASWQEILQLPTRTLTRKDVISIHEKAVRSHSKFRKLCILCSRSFRPKDVVRTLPCEHCFHTNCIDPYLFLQAECPECKHPAIALEL